MKENIKKTPTIIGFREWIAFPELGLSALKAKVDTGAKTSSLHAFDIKLVKRGGVTYVKFKVHPIQKNTDHVVECSSLLVDRRVVTDSGGHKENRYVINVVILMGSVKKTIQLTLTNRASMKYRMLLGREALNQFYIDPSQSYLLRKSQKQKIYLKELKQTSLADD